MRKVKIGLIGCGGMGKGHIRSMKELSNARLTAVADVSEEAARQVGEENRVPWFSRAEKLLDSGLCEAVIIATPHYDHPVIGKLALEKGLHVLTEKPMTVTVSEADRFLAAAKKSGKVFAVMYQRRLSPEIRLARKLIADGALGEIRRTLMIDPWYRSQAYYDSGGWRGTWAGEGGGVLLNQSPHQIDIFMLLAGLPTRVSALTRTFLHDIEVEDQACAMLEYANGALGYFYASTFEVPSTPTMEIVGDSGKLAWRDGRLSFFEVKPNIAGHINGSAEMWGKPTAREKKLRLPAEKGGHGGIIREFCNAILRGSTLTAPGEEGIWSIEFINALILSGHTGRPVDIPVNRGEYDRLIEKLKKTTRPKKVVRVKRETDPKFK